MTTVYLSVAQRVEALLNAGPPVSALVWRARVRPLPKAAKDAVVVRLVDSRTAEKALNLGGLLLHGTQLAVESYARAEGDTPADEAVDPLLEAVVNRILADPTLGGAAGTLDLVGVGWDFDADGEKTACATAVFAIKHAGLTNSITALP